MDDSGFLPPNLLIGDPDYLTRCVGLPPGSRPVMTHRARLVAAALAGCSASVVACTQRYLYDERRRRPAPGGPDVTIEGRFCTLGTNEVVRPIKILFAMDASQSMRVTDPNGTRASAVVELIRLAAPRPEDLLQRDALRRQHHRAPHQDRPARVRAAVSPTPRRTAPRSQDQILNFTNPQLPNRDSTDFVKPLADIYALINTDIAEIRNNATAAAGGDPRPLLVIFLSDGHPTINQDDELLQGDAVRAFAS